MSATATIFKQLTLTGAKTTAWNEFSSTMASAIICLATNQNFNFSKYIFDHMVKNSEDGVKFLMFPIFVQVFLDSQVEGMLKHKDIYVTPSHTKKIFANMNRQGKDFSGKVTPLFETMMGRMIADLDADEGVVLVDETHGRNDQDMFDTIILDDEEVVAEEVDDEEVVAKEVVAKKEVSTVDPVFTAGEVVTIAGFKKDQIMIDEKVARNLKAQMQAELEEEERLVRQKKEEANIALVAEWDNTQAMMDADYELATRLQE
uniref:Synaptobrevin, longin-like domain protein n=1 Tax=Tanacetum cinerariifolium TaxID=118510 RepID=A0A6L2L1J2_TANCI|nr:hypothetical protein [Tanacetum cinerariifolium]